MVTFMCAYCDVTLKKKQCDTHIRGRCRPAALTCIDCHQTFQADTYKQHVACISEMDKHWGQYAKKNKQPQHKQQNKSQVSWKGWKNQIKAIIKQNQQPIEYDQLKHKVLLRYKQKTGQEEDEEIFDSKLRNIKRVKLTSYVTLQ